MGTDTAQSPPTGCVMIPPHPPVASRMGRAITVLVRKGSLRRAEPARPCALRSVLADPSCDGRLRRDPKAAFLAIYTKGDSTKRVTDVVTGKCNPCCDVHSVGRRPGGLPHQTTRFSCRQAWAIGPWTLLLVAAPYRRCALSGRRRTATIGSGQHQGLFRFALPDPQLVHPLQRRTALPAD